MADMASQKTIQRRNFLETLNYVQLGKAQALYKKWSFHVKLKRMSNPSEINIIDCPRDAIEGRISIIRPEKKIAQMMELIRSELVEYIDFASFVSNQVFPQVQGTSYVVHGIEIINKTKVLAVVANTKG